MGSCLGTDLAGVGSTGNLQGTGMDEKGKTDHSLTSTEARTHSSDAGLHKSAEHTSCKHAALTDTNGKRRNKTAALGTKNQIAVYLPRKITVQ